MLGKHSKIHHCLVCIVPDDYFQQNLVLHIRSDGQKLLRSSYVILHTSYILWGYQFCRKSKAQKYICLFRFHWRVIIYSDLASKQFKLTHRMSISCGKHFIWIDVIGKLQYQFWILRNMVFLLNYWLLIAFIFLYSVLLFVTSFFFFFNCSVNLNR